MLTQEMRQHLAKNNDQPEHPETEEEKLARALHPLMEAAELDEQTPLADEPKYARYNALRLTTTEDPAVNGRSGLRQLFYHEAIPYTLGSLFQLGTVFTSSRFNKIERMKDFQGVYSGVRTFLYGVSCRLCC